MSKSKTKKPNTNKSGSYKPKSATFSARSAGDNTNKAVRAQTASTNNTKTVKAEISKNGEDINQTIKTKTAPNGEQVTKIKTQKNNGQDNSSQKVVKNSATKSAQNSAEQTDNNTTIVNGYFSQHNNSTSLNQTRDFTSAVPKSSHLHKPKYPENWWVWLLVTIGVTILAGAIATILGGKMFNFRSHTLPPLMAPKIVFPIAWALIYVAIGVSGFFAFVSPFSNVQTRRGDIIWFSINLFFNILWPLFFYRLDMLIVSTIICGIVVITAIITNYRFYYRSIVAGVIYSVYTLWLLYAFYLNLGICLLNA